MFEDYDLSATNATTGSAKVHRTGRYRFMMCVRNASGGALAAAKKICKLKTDGSAYQYAGQVMALSEALEFGYPGDEYLTASVAQDDLFWVCVGGPAMCVTAGAGDTNISTGAFVVPAGTGTVTDQLVAEDDADIFPQMNSAVGRAILGVNATTTNILIDVTRRI